LSQSPNKIPRELAGLHGDKLVDLEELASSISMKMTKSKTDKLITIMRTMRGSSCMKVAKEKLFNREQA